MLLPGPEAMQLATYVGWRLHGTLGGLAAGLLFVLPGAFVVLGLSILMWFALHVLFGNVAAAWHGPVQLWTPELASLNVEALLLSVLAAALLLRLHFSIASTLAITAAAALAWSLAATGM